MQKSAPESVNLLDDKSKQMNTRIKNLQQTAEQSNHEVLIKNSLGKLLNTTKYW